MIPKTIHYCWFGRNPKPADVLRYIATWRKHCPDYGIVEWNEENFDVAENDYAREAYESRKWAFVTDYVRLAVLHRHGGIYMDTDVEVLKSLDPFLRHAAFTGFQSREEIPTGIMGAEAGNPWIAMLLAHYDGRHFLRPDGSMDTTVNIVPITRATLAHSDLRLDGTFQVTDQGLAVYPQAFFCPFDYIDYRNSGARRRAVTADTHAIHHFMGSWNSGGTKLRRRILGLLGPRITGWLRRLKRAGKGGGGRG